MRVTTAPARLSSAAVATTIGGAGTGWPDTAWIDQAQDNTDGPEEPAGNSKLRATSAFRHAPILHQVARLVPVGPSRLTMRVTPICRKDSVEWQHS
jgi:hypothetical protein